MSIPSVTIAGIIEWLIVLKTLMIGVSILINIFLLGRLDNQTHQIDTQAHQIKLLSEQVKQLSTDNKFLNTQTRDYVKCGFDLFAGYTRDGQPISIENLQKCQVTFSVAPATANAGAQAAPQQSSPVFVLPPSTQSAPNPSNKPAETSQQPNKPLNCTVDLLGLHIGCP